MNRRNFMGSVAGLAAGTAFAGWPKLGAAAAGSEAIKLAATTRSLDVNGKAAKVFGLLQPDGTHGLRLMAGEDFNVLLNNDVGAETLIHWHGLTPPWPMDGFPDMPAPLMKAGESRAYQFPLTTPGTHWMHAHTLQEQSLLAAPLIVRTKEEASLDEQEVVILLHDFSFKAPEELLAGLSGKGGMSNMNMKGNGQSKMSGMKIGGMATKGMDMGGGMMMDINDIEFDAYLANDRSLDDPEVVKVEKGGKIRLRIINGAAATAFTIDTGTLSGEVIAVDGQNVKPVKASKVPLSMGQRVDIRLNIPAQGGAFPILALREGAKERTGIILATAGAAVKKVPTKGNADGPVLALDFERKLNAVSALSARKADRKFVVSLTGDMQAYQWSMKADKELKIAKGERIEVELRNGSMMAHPMHLHGHHYQVTAIDGTPINGALRDTVFVPPMARVSFAFDADNPGGAWAFHCHHLYHMVSGMMTSFSYES